MLKERKIEESGRGDDFRLLEYGDKGFVIIVELSFPLTDLISGEEPVSAIPEYICVTDVDLSILFLNIFQLSCVCVEGHNSGRSAGRVN